MQGVPVVGFQNDQPFSFTYRRPGTPLSGILPSDMYFNLVEQPGNNVPGATFIQKHPTPTGGIATNINYFGQNPQEWKATLEPGTATPPRGTTAEFNVYPDPDQEESGTAFSNPAHKILEVPGLSHLPDLKDNLKVLFDPSRLPPPGSEVVYIQTPPGTGRYYLCPGVTLSQFVELKTKEEVARLCGVPPEFLDADFMVFTFNAVRQAQQIS